MVLTNICKNLRFQLDPENAASGRSRPRAQGKQGNCNGMKDQIKKGFLESSYVCFFFLKENIDKKKLELSTALFLNYTLAFTESDTSDFSTLSLL